MSATQCIKFRSDKFKIYKDVVVLYRQHMDKLAQTIRPRRNVDIRNLFDLNNTITNVDSLEAFTDQIYEHIGQDTFNTYLERFNDNMVFPISQILTKYNCTWTDIEKSYYIYTIYNAYVGYKAQYVIFDSISNADKSLKIVQTDNLDRHGIDYLLVSDNLKIALQVKSIKSVVTDVLYNKLITGSYNKAKKVLKHNYKDHGYYFLFYYQDKQDNYYIAQEQTSNTDTYKMLFTYEELAQFNRTSYSYNNIITSNGSITFTTPEHLTNYIGSLFMVKNMDNNTGKDNNNND